MRTNLVCCCLLREQSTEEDTVEAESSGKSLSWYYSIDSEIVEVRAFRAALSFM